LENFAGAKRRHGLMVKANGEMERAETLKGGKRRYMKPELKRVQLRPEEAVLGACKIASNAGPTGTCNTCSTTGS
jgi:hypothetical protein